MNIKDILSKINFIKKATNFECLILLILTKKLFKYAKEILKGNFMVCALKLIMMVFIFDTLSKLLNHLLQARNFFNL